MQENYNQRPLSTIQTKNRSISIFSIEGDNIDAEVVDTFGDEWIKFKDYSNKEIDSVAQMYFDVLNENIINKNTYAIDIGCGTGRWSKYLAQKVKFIEAVDPSHAIYAADELLKGVENIRITKASVETLPFDDEVFDFGMSIGVLHHIPDTQQAMKDCVKKIKRGGHFYCYLYYNLEGRGIVFHALFQMSNVLRKGVCKLPSKAKKLVCDVLAVALYMPFIYVSRFFNFLGLKNIGQKIPLSAYADKSFFIIRNDSLDRFGTKLEQRFSKKEVISMMENSGLENIVVSTGAPYYHAVGRKK